MENERTKVSNITIYFTNKNIGLKTRVDAGTTHGYQQRMDGLMAWRYCTGQQSTFDQFLIDVARNVGFKELFQ